MTQTVTTVDAHGTKKTTQWVFVRFSKSTGLAGAWIDANALDRQPQMMVTRLTNGIFHLGFPIENQYTDMKLDGQDAPTHGTYSGARVTLSVKLDGSLRLLTVQKVDGRAVSQGALTLSSDGGSITQETWRPEEPTVKSRLVYEKP